MKYRVPGLTFVLSDFLAPEGEELPFDHLADEGHEVHFLHLAGPADREPPWRGELELYDAESDAVIRISLDDRSAREYREAYDRFCESLERRAKRSRAQYVHLSTAVPLEQALFREMAATRVSAGRAMEVGRRSMGLLNLALGQLLGIFLPIAGLLVALYFYDRSRRRVLVSTLRFWPRRPAPAVRQRHKRIQHPLSLLLQLVALLLLLLAIADPRPNVPGVAARQRIVLFDTSRRNGPDRR